MLCGLRRADVSELVSPAFLTHLLDTQFTKNKAKLCMQIATHGFRLYMTRFYKLASSQREKSPYPAQKPTSDKLFG